MSNQKRRRQYKRAAQSAHQHFRRAAEQLYYLYTIFKEPHPDEAEFIEAMIQMALQCELGIEALWQKCWGELPKDWEKRPE